MEKNLSCYRNNNNLLLALAINCWRCCPGIQFCWLASRVMCMKKERSTYIIVYDSGQLSSSVGLEFLASIASLCWLLDPSCWLLVLSNPTSSMAKSKKILEIIYRVNCHNGSQDFSYLLFLPILWLMQWRLGENIIILPSLQIG